MPSLAFPWPGKQAPRQDATRTTDATRVIALCRQAEVAPPGFRETGTSVVVTFRVRVGETASILVGDTDQVTDQAIDQVTPKVTPQVTSHVGLLLEAALEPRTRQQLQTIIGLKDRHHFINTHLRPLLQAGWLERTAPDKPSSLQRYRTTAAGLEALKKRRP